MIVLREDNSHLRQTKHSLPPSIVDIFKNIIYNYPEYSDRAGYQKAKHVVENNGIVTMEWLKGMKSFFKKYDAQKDIEYKLGGGRVVKDFIEKKLERMTAATPKTRKKHTNNAVKPVSSADNLSGNRGNKSSTALSMVNSLMSGILVNGIKKEINGKTIVITESQLKDLTERLSIFALRNYLNEENKKDMPSFLSNKKLTSRSRQFLYHGTNISPEKFILRDDYDFEDSNSWSGDLPEGYLFLTTNIKEAMAYGRYIIPCELKWNDSKIFNVNANNPSQIFDRDYGIDLYTNDEEFGFWDKFEESGKSNLVIKGLDRSTVITYVENVIPRVDLAIEFYQIDNN